MSAGNGSLSGLSIEELRAAVRAVLRDVLPPAVTQPDRTATVSAVLASGPTEVTLRTDADLDAFVRRVAALCEDPGQRATLRDGDRRFRLAGASAGGTSPLPEGPDASVQRIERGAVTERAVKKAAADGVRLVIGRQAVLTPLARDKARTLGVVIERER